MARRPTTKTDAGPIDIDPVQRTEIRIFVLGLEPLIFNAVSQKAQRELLYPTGRKNAAARASSLKHVPIEEYRASVYRFKHDRAPTRLCLPATCFKKALRQAALRVPGVAKTEISQLIWTRGDGDLSADWIPVYGVPQLLMSVVRNSDQNHTPDIRTRAILPRWCCSFRLIYVSPLLTGRTVVNLTNTSGLICGVGDFRQEKGAGSYGQFEIVDPDNAEFAEIARATMLADQDAALEKPEFYDFDSESNFTWFEAERRRRGREPIPEDDDEDLEDAA